MEKTKNIKIDLKDRKLMYELDMDCSRTVSQLAKKTGMSKERTLYRINRLVKHGYIPFFQAHINLPRIGLTEYALLLKLSSADKEDVKELIDYTVKLEYSFYAARTGGKYDLLIGFLEKNIYDFEDHWKQLLARFSRIILDYDISIRTSFTQFSKDYLLKKILHPRHFMTYKKAEPIEIDNEEKKILGMVTVNSRQSIYEISKKTKIPPSTVRYKLRKLEKQGVIIAYKAWVDDFKMGKRFSMILLKTKGITSRERTKLFEHLKNSMTVFAYIETIGRWDLEVYTSFEDIKEVHDFVLELTDKFTEQIRESETLALFDVFKYSYYPFKTK